MTAYGPVIQLALRRAKQPRGHLVTSIVAASKDFTLGRVNTPVAKMQAHQLHRFVDLQASDGIFRLQLDSSSSADHPNVPDAELTRVSQILRLRLNQAVVQTLVVAFAMIMDHEALNRRPQ